MRKILNKLLITINILIFAAVFASYASTTHAQTTTAPILVIDGQTVELDVADILTLEDKFFAYVTDKENLIWNVSNEDTVYFVEENLKVYALRAGTSTIQVRSEDGTLSSSFTVEVKKVNLYQEGNFEHFTTGTVWTATNQTINNWRLYTANAPVQPFQQVSVVQVERDGQLTKAIHASHDEIAYSTIFSHVTLPEAGNYYVEFDMKGENVQNQRVYGRFNVNTPTATQTIGMNGTFDWQHFTSDVVEVTGNTLQVELYGANYRGKVWYDNVAIYKVVNKEYFGYDLNTALIDLKIGQSFTVEPQINPDSIIEHAFYFDTLDQNVATVDRHGVVTAVGHGVTSLVVTDKVLQLEKRVYIIVGDETNLVVEPISVVMNEDEVKDILVEYTGHTNDVQVYKYINPTYGNYYIKGTDTIVYAPNKHFNSNQTNSQLGTTNDSFQVIVYEEAKGYKVLDISVYVEGKDDPATVVDFWQSTKKNTTLSDGYVQILSSDIEVEIPAIKQAELNTSGQLVLKTEAYSKIKTTLNNNQLSGTTQEGGMVNILFDGESQLIYDRYYSSQNKVIFGMKYTYEPKEDFFGYDYFDIKITNGSETTTFKVTIYVAPDYHDFKFDETDFSGFYVMGNDEWIQETKQAYANNDPYITRWIDQYIDQFAVYNPTGVPADSRSPLEHLGILYQATGDLKYAELAWQQMHEVTKDNTFDGGDGTKRSSWGGASNGFLDAAMVTYSVAFAYNMIYDTLDSEQQLQVVRALYEEGFYWFETIANPNVLLHGNNHNLLVNANLAIAAFAVMSYEGDIDVSVDGIEKTINVKMMGAEIVSKAYELLQVALVHYSPSGGFPEGPGYSYYAHRNMIGLLSTLKNIYGGESFEEIYDFGLSQIGGILNYSEYTLYSSTPNNDLFYYNEGAASINQPGLLWYARMDEKYIPYTLINKITFERDINTVLGLLWYKPGSFDNLDVSTVRPLDALMEVHEFASFRNGFGDEFGIFAALKGFNPTSNLFTHKSLDSGTFELVAFGEKFIENFSHEDYQISVPPGFWDYDYGRFTYYKKQPQGHNTVIFNPQDNPVLQQDPYEKAPITSFQSTNDGGYAVVDLSDVYKSNVIEYHRGLKLDEDRSMITLQDEFKLRKESTYYWSVHTLANIEIIHDKLAALSLNGKKVYISINSEGGKFEKMDAVPLPGTIGKYFNLQNEGVNKLIIHEDNITEGTISVTFKPSMHHIDELDVKREVMPISTWTLKTDTPDLDIRVDDISFNAQTGHQYKYEFIPYQYSYMVKLLASEQFVPKLNVTYNKDKYDVEVINAINFGSLSYVYVTDKVTGHTKTYQYRFIVDVFVDGYDDYIKYDNIVVSGDSDNIEYLVSDDRNDVWRVSERAEALFDFGETKRISNVSMRFISGILYEYYFDIYAGDSIDNLEPVYYAGVSTNKIGDEMYSLGEVNARYVKIVFNGNNENYETAISRINFYDNGYVFEDDNLQQSNSNLLFYVIGGSVLTLLASGAGVIVIINKKKIKR